MAWHIVDMYKEGRYGTVVCMKRHKQDTSGKLAWEGSAHTNTRGNSFGRGRTVSAGLWGAVVSVGSSLGSLQLRGFYVLDWGSQRASVPLCVRCWHARLSNYYSQGVTADPRALSDADGRKRQCVLDG